MASSTKRTHPEGTGFLEAGATSPSPRHGDPTSGAAFSAMWIWNGTAYEKFQGPGKDVAGVWGVELFDKDGGSDVVYRGVNVAQDALTSAETWWVWKFTWASGDPTQIELLKDVAYDDRATLAWRA